MIVKLKNVHYQIPRGSTIYEDLNLEIYEGDFIGVLGKNGAGKTTLMDLLMGYRPISSGEISVMGEDPMSPFRRNKKNIYTLSHDIHIQKSHRVKDYLEFTKFFYPNFSDSIAKSVLEFLDIDPNVKFAALSTGQKVKAQVAGAFASQAKLILMDEVTAVLDPESRKKFFTLLKSAKKQGDKSVIMATNIAEDLNGTTDKVLFIDNKNAQVHGIEEIKHLFNLNDYEEAA